MPLKLFRNMGVNRGVRGREVGASSISVEVDEQGLAQVLNAWAGETARFV